MTHSEVRHLLAGIMVLSSLFVLGSAAWAYRARRLWRGTALMGGGCLLMGLVGIATESRDELGGTLTIVAGMIVVAGSLTERREKKMGVG
ncbi:MAG: hypothetical protein IPP98_05505 [Gemmatimonadetes bacterium]|nr:hypothetical protein [Gemmatimonadota bacterium]